jgi:hypothetical protein
MRADLHTDRRPACPAHGRSALRWLGLLWLAGLVGLSGLAGCSSSAQAGPNSAQGSATGTLRLTGGPPGADPLTASGEVYAFATADLSGDAVAKQKTQSDGSYRLALAPGTYYLAATSSSFVLDPPASTPPCRADGPVTITAGGESQVSINCERK